MALTTTTTTSTTTTTAMATSTRLFHQRFFFFVTCLGTLLLHGNKFLHNEWTEMMPSSTSRNSLPITYQSRRRRHASTPYKTLTNYTSDQGYDPIEPHVTDQTMIRQYLQSLEEQHSTSFNNDNDNHNIIPRSNNKRIIYVITPTYQRLTQMVDLIRLSQTLTLANMKAANSNYQIYWIVIEDHEYCTKRVRYILERTEGTLLFAHLSIKTTQHTNPRHRGVEQRNIGLDLIVDTLSSPKEVDDSIVYFADDDNAYDVRVFDEISKLDTERYNVGIMGVAFRGGKLYSRCTVDPNTGKVDNILSDYQKPPDDGVAAAAAVGTSSSESLLSTMLKQTKDYAMDMAGFCISVKALLLKKKNGTNKRSRFFNYDWETGSLESNFLKQVGGITSMKDFQPLADDCTKILVWHVKTTTGYENKPKSKLSLLSTDPKYQQIKPSI